MIQIYLSTLILCFIAFLMIDKMCIVVTSASICNCQWNTFNASTDCINLVQKGYKTMRVSNLIEYTSTNIEYAHTAKIMTFSKSDFTFS